MQMNMPGCLPGSYYHLPVPPLSIQKHFYYITILGHFYCDKQYYAKRKAYFAGPLMMCLLEGHMHVNINGIGYDAGPDDIVLINCAIPHIYQANPSCEFVYMHFNGLNAIELAQHVIEQNGGPVFKVKTYAKIQSLLKSLLYKIDYNQFVPETEYSRTVYDAICYLSYNSKNDVATNEYVSNAINFIHSHLELPLKLGDIAAHINVSPYHFSRLFKEDTGIAPMEYVAIAKTDAAKTLLKTTSLPVAEIAAQLGYHNLSSFSNFFSSRVGLSPKQFRDSVIL